jgi:hypothetical protein
MTLDIVAAHRLTDSVIANSSVACRGEGLLHRSLPLLRTPGSAVSAVAALTPLAEVSAEMKIFVLEQI